MGTTYRLLATLSYCLAIGCDAFDNEAFERLRTEFADSDEPDANPSSDAGDEDAAADEDGGVELPEECNSGTCWWSTITADQCVSAGRPDEDDRPSAQSDDELPPFYLGVSRLKLAVDLPEETENADAMIDFGIDLDGVCTSSLTCNPDSREQSCAPATEQLPFDGTQCRDNTFARLQPIAAEVPVLGEGFGISESAFNCALRHGDYTSVLRISGYNGMTEDDDVRLDVYTSVGLENASRGFTCPNDDFDSYPMWRPSWTWLIDEADLDGPIETPGELPDSKVSSVYGYVRESYLVAKLPDGTRFRLPGDNSTDPGFNLTLQNSVWIGRLEQQPDTTWRVRDGLITGAIFADDLVASFRQIGLCPGIHEDLDVIYDTIENVYLREYADVLADGRVDPDEPCDAISLGIGISADPITPGSAVEISPLVDCPPPPDLSQWLDIDSDTDGGVP